MTQPRRIRGGEGGHEDLESLKFVEISRNTLRFKCSEALHYTFKSKLHGGHDRTLPPPAACSFSFSFLACNIMVSVKKHDLAEAWPIVIPYTIPSSVLRFDEVCVYEAAYEC